MSARREAMLEEMGLAPRWRLRPRAQDVEKPQAAPEEATACALRNEQQAEHQRSAEVAASGGSATSREERRAAIMRLDWSELEASVAACRACALHARRNNTVFGVGDQNADWLFVGEGPGAEEDAQGEPFVGQAGKLLDNMLAAIGLKRGENVYIANVVKCRPPGNRNPEPDEALQCEPYLTRQIELIKPRLIVALGRVAATGLLARDASIASLRARVHEYRGIPLVVTYHPAYLLRNLADKAKAWEDLCLAVRKMAEVRESSIVNRQS